MMLQDTEYADLAEYYHIKGNVEKCENTALDGLEMWPDSLQLLILLARLELQTFGDTERARMYVERISETEDPDYHYIVAELLMTEGLWGNADQYLHEKMELIDDDEERMEFVLDVANIYADYDRQVDMENWMALYDDHEDLNYMELVARSFAFNKEYAKSEEVLERILDGDPFCVSTWNNLAMMQYLQGKFEEAWESCEYLTALDPNDLPGIRMCCLVLFSMHRCEEAAEKMTEYLKYFPDDEEILLMQSITLGCLDREDEALRVVKHLRKISKKK